jgi:hypothetical protein
MRNFLSFILLVVLVVVLIDVIAPLIGPGMGAAWPAVDRRMSSQVADRTHKSDRLQVPRANGRRVIPQGAPVLVGCEPVFSALSKEKQANFPGRCLS